LTTEYWLAAVLAVVVAALLSALVYLVVVRRLASAPPLVGTVATIAVSALLLALTILVLNHLLSEPAVPAGIAPPPQDVHVRMGSGALDLGAILTLVAAVLALPAIELFLRRSRIGTAVRAAADNPDRAATLGVDGPTVTTAMWTLSGALAG